LYDVVVILLAECYFLVGSNISLLISTHQVLQTAAA